MAALTPTSTYVESLGSLTLWVVNLTGGSTSDTWTIPAGSAVLDYWCQPNIGSTSTSVIDVAYVTTTGVFTFSTVTNYGAFTLFILVLAPHMLYRMLFLSLSPPLNWILPAPWLV